MLKTARTSIGCIAPFKNLSENRPTLPQNQPDKLSDCWGVLRVLPPRPPGGRTLCPLRSQCAGSLWAVWVRVLGVLPLARLSASVRVCAWPYVCDSSVWGEDTQDTEPQTPFPLGRAANTGSVCPPPGEDTAGHGRTNGVISW